MTELIIVGIACLVLYQLVKSAAAIAVIAVILFVGLSVFGIKDPINFVKQEGKKIQKKSKGEGFGGGCIRGEPGTITIGDPKKCKPRPERKRRRGSR